MGEAGVTSPNLNSIQYNIYDIQTVIGTIATLNSSTINCTTGNFNNLNVANNFTALNSTVTNETVNEASITTATIGSETVTNSTIGSLTATSASIGILSGTSCNFSSGTIGTLTSTNANINSLTATSSNMTTSTIGTLTSTNASIGSGTFTSANIAVGTVGTLTSSNANITLATIPTLVTTTLTAANGNISALVATSATLTSASISTLTATTSNITSGIFTNLTSSNGTISTLNSTNATLSSASIPNLTATTATITTLSGGTNTSVVNNLVTTADSSSVDGTLLEYSGTSARILKGSGISGTTLAGVMSYLSALSDGVSDSGKFIVLGSPVTSLGFISTGSAVSITGNVETVLTPTGVGSLTVASNVITPGSLFEFNISGTISAVLGSGLTLRLYTGSSSGTVIASFAPSLSLLSSVGWTANIQVVCKTNGATGTLQANGTCNLGTNSIIYSQQAVTGFDTTGANVFKITAVWGAVSVGNNITCNFASASYTFQS